MRVAFNKVLVYSGDDDSICATLGTQQWIWDMGMGGGIYGYIETNILKYAIHFYKNYIHMHSAVAIRPNIA